MPFICPRPVFPGRSTKDFVGVRRRCFPASERLRSALLRAVTESSAASEKQSSLTPADVGGLVLDTLWDDASPLFGPEHGMREVRELRKGEKEHSKERNNPGWRRKKLKTGETSLFVREKISVLKRLCSVKYLHCAKSVLSVYFLNDSIYYCATLPKAHFPRDHF